VGWSIDPSGGDATMTVSDDAHAGKHSLCIEATKWYHNPSSQRHGDRKYINVTLIHGTQSAGESGLDAYRVEGDRRYQCTFWMKSTAPKVTFRAIGWRVGQEDRPASGLREYPTLIEATNEWKQYTATFYSQVYSTRAAVAFGFHGYQDEGVELGKVWIDDIRVEPWSR
jgi:hypothetical protein